MTITTLCEAPGVLKPSEAARIMNISPNRLKALLACPKIFPPGSWVRSETGRIWIQREAVERALTGQLSKSVTQAVRAELQAKKQARNELDYFNKRFGK